jgi:hypothetical protein
MQGLEGCLMPVKNCGNTSQHALSRLFSGAAMTPVT